MDIRTETFVLNGKIWTITREIPDELVTKED